MKTAVKGVGAIQGFRSDPIGYLIDTLVAVVVNLFIPIPFAGEAVKRFRGPVLAFLASMILMGFFLIFVVGTAIMSPFLVTSGFLEQLQAGLNGPTFNVGFDDSFASTSIPLQNPLGGPGMAYTTISSHFNSASYYLKFGRKHYGVDLVPTDTYFASSSTYSETKKVVAFSTINGTVDRYTDEYGGKTVAVTNDEGTYKAVFIHFSQILVEDGVKIQAGTPIGVMGRTGRATGEHVHYEVRIKQGSGWNAVNPLSYIQ